MVGRCNKSFFDDVVDAIAGTVLFVVDLLAAKDPDDTLDFSIHFDVFDK